MKIVIILPDMGGGGAERLHLNLSNEWINSGHMVYFFLLRKKGELIHLLHPDASIIDLKVDKLRRAICPITLGLRKIKPDIILSAMWPLTSLSVIAWLLSGKQGKLFLSDHVILSLESKNNINVPLIFVKALLLGTYYFANGIIAVSSGVKKDLQSLGRFSDYRIEVIYNPAAIGRLRHNRNIDLDEDLWGAGSFKKILAVGSLKKEKDFEMLIKSFSLLSSDIDAKLVILGEGPQRATLEKLIISLGLTRSVNMPGFVCDPYPWYLGADLFVLSSKWEGFGNVIVESLECGTPVVSTDCPGGPREILENGRYGILVDVGSKLLLANAIKKSLSMRHKYKELKKRAKAFSAPCIAKQYINYFYKK